VPSLPSQCLGAPTRSVLAAPPGHLPLSRTRAVAPASFALVLPSFPLPTHELPVDGSVQYSHQRPCTFGWVEGLAGGLVTPVHGRKWRQQSGSDRGHHSAEHRSVRGSSGIPCCIRCRISTKAAESQTVAAFSPGLRADSALLARSSSGKLSALLLG